MVTSDLDNNGKAEIIASFPSNGTWVFRNNSEWTFLHSYTALVLAVGQLDGGHRPISSVILARGSEFGSTATRRPGPCSIPTTARAWSWQTSTAIGVTKSSSGLGPAGVWKNNNGVWSQLHPFSVTALVASRSTDDE